MPIRASCAYPGLFLPIRYEGHLLVDGFVSMEVPAEPLQQLGADRVISVAIPNQNGTQDYGNMLGVVSRCFQILSERTQNSWQRHSSLVITPRVADMSWDSFAAAKKMIQLGEQAAREALPSIQTWLSGQSSQLDIKSSSLGALGSVTVNSSGVSSSPQIQS